MIRLSFKQATATIMAGLVLGAVALVVGASLATATPPPPVDPPSYSATLASGSSVTITKTVNTPEIPPKPDIVFLSDTTGSMGGAIANVKASINSPTGIIQTVLTAQPGAQFGAAQYKDGRTPTGCPSDVFAFNLDQGVTASVPAVQTAVNTWSASGGCDIPESQLNALYQLATGSTGWRSGSTRIIAWFGDAPGHDPDLGITEAVATAALQAANIQVIAVNVGNLDSTGQAARITGATGGVLLPAGGDVAGAILSGLQNLPVTVTPVATCDPGLTATYNPASQTVTSGDPATFDETLSVAANAPDGGVLYCTVDFLLNGEHVDGFQQNVAITVPLRATDLSITKTGPAFVQTGGSVTYTLTAKNNGTDPDTNVTVSDTLPSGETLVSATPSQGTCGLPDVTCNLGTLGAGASATVTIVANVTAASGSTLVNTATVTGDRPDANTANNSSTTSAFAYGVVGQGGFVIGDKNAAPGTAVTFWGAQWWKLNSLTGGAAPAAFKGYALNPTLPACGTNWSTDPGNSAPPPAGPLPAYMAVIVASKITKSGSQISGDTAHIVIVKTNPGYAANPGHAGTGTVFATLC